MAADEPVTRKEFEELSENVGDLLKLIKKEVIPVIRKSNASEPESKEDKEAAKAAPNKYQVNTEWEAMAKEIVGEAVDHTELEFVKGGGQLFTIVIKPEFSNAPRDYLERYSVDRRSKEIGQEGEAGVKVWCEMVRNNLKKPRTIV